MLGLLPGYAVAECQAKRSIDQHPVDQYAIKRHPQVQAPVRLSCIVNLSNGRSTGRDADSNILDKIWTICSAATAVIRLLKKTIVRFLERAPFVVMQFPLQA